MRVRGSEESHNILCPLFLFGFDAKRKSETEKEKHEQPNGTSYQVQSPRTPKKEHVITSQNNEQIGHGLEQSDVVILNTGTPLTLYKGRGSKEMTINNSANGEKENNMKTLIDLKNCSLAHLWERARVRVATHVDMPPTKAKFAFTLAEVLITLGIIGVVAAMTIPTLIFKIQKPQIEAQIRENYSSIAQVMKMAENDDIGPFNIDLSNGALAINRKWFETYIVPYMKVEQVCYSTGGCWHKYGVVKTLNGVAPTWETKVGISDSLIGGIGYALAFRTVKGSYFDTDTSTPTQTSNIFGVDSTENSLQFYFDVNGDRKPNIIGKDIYILVYDSDRGLVPARFDRTKEEVKENCESGNGYWCLGYVKDNGWKIPDTVWKRTK